MLFREGGHKIHYVLNYLYVVIIVAHKEDFKR